MGNGDPYDGEIQRLNQLDRVLSIIQETKLNELPPKEKVSPNSAPLMFKETMAALQGDIFNKRPPINGTIVSCFMDFPIGCRGLVDVKVSKNSHDIVPVNGYLAIEGHYETQLRERVSMGDTITVEINNHDEINEHQITVVLTIIGD